MSRHPTVKWAQRSDKLFLTVDLPDAKDVKHKLDPDGKFSFAATRDGVPYQVEVELLDKINTEESNVNIGVRDVAFFVKKAESKWWGRLLKQEGKPPAFVKVDWDKWVDEDEENEKADMDFKNNDLSKQKQKKKKKKKKKPSKNQSLPQKMMKRLRFDCFCGN